MLQQTHLQNTYKSLSVLAIVIFNINESFKYVHTWNIFFIIIRKGRYSSFLLIAFMHEREGLNFLKRSLPSYSYFLKFVCSF